MPVEIAQHLINGILLGGIFAVVAVGFSLVWGIMNIINLTHGAFIMLGAYLTYWLFTLFGVDPFLSIPLSMVVMFGLGYLIQLRLINLVIRAPLLVTFLLTFGLETLFVNLALRAFTGDQRSVTTAYSGAGLALGGLQISYVRVATLAVALVLTFLFNAGLNRTRIGQGIRATGMDLVAARLAGINIARTYAMTYAMGAAAAAAAGSLIAISYTVTPGMGSAYTVRAFAICVMGGLGSVPGALLGGLVLGLIEEFGTAYIPHGTGYADAITFGALVLVLIFRPRGLIGKAFYQ